MQASHLSFSSLAPSARLIPAAGPIELQSVLVKFVLEWSKESGVTAALRPLRILVSSGTIRDRLLRALAQESSGALIGVEIQSVLSLAEELLKRTGQRFTQGDQVFEILVRRVAGDRPWVRQRVGDLSDGLGLVSSSVRDLLGAGLTPVLADSIQNALGDAEGSDWSREILHIAIEVSRELSEISVRRRAGIMTEAASVLQEQPHFCPKTDQFVLFGFSDAPGTTIDLIQALSHVAPTTIFLDMPRDVFGRQAESVGCAYPRRFARLLGVDLPRGKDTACDPARPGLVAAPDRPAEVREMAWRVRDQIAAGVQPEDITVVVPDLTVYGPLIRHHFSQLALPYTAGSVALPLAPEVRLPYAWGQLLDRRELLDLDVFVELLSDDESGVVRQKQVLAFRAMGASRLGDIASLKPGDHADSKTGQVRLPVRHAAIDPDGSGVGKLVACSIDVQGLNAIVSLAHSVLDMLRGLPEKGTVFEFTMALQGLSNQTPCLRINEAVTTVFAEVSDGLPTRFLITRDEFGRLLSEAIVQAERATLNGDGGGVAVVNWIQVRGCASKRLHVLGVNRGVLPKKGGQDDPFLPDRMRRRVQEFLPSLSLKAENEAESQHLFASMLSAAPDVTLSWLSSDEGGKAMQPSPYLQRLFVECESLEGEVIEIPVLRDEQLKVRSVTELPIDDALQLAGLHRSFEALQPLLQEVGSVPEAAAAQLHAVEAMESIDGGSNMVRLGQVGVWADSPVYRESLPVTFLEAVARCPWAAYVEKVLYLSPLPDPTAELPEISRLMLGNCVHLALEQLSSARGGELQDRLDAKITAVERPTDDELTAHIEYAVRRVTLSEGLDYPGLQKAVFELAFPMVKNAIDLHWKDNEPVPVVGVELTHSHYFVDAESNSRQITFKADRVDCIDGNVRLFDYKTGSKHLTDRGLKTGIADGTSLQAALYAASTLETGHPSEGAYLYVSDKPKAIGLKSDDIEMQDLFEGAVSEILKALDSGSMIPRMLNSQLSDKGPQCGYCQFKQVCVIGDVTIRKRLAEDAGQNRLPAAFQSIWNLKDTVGAFANRMQEERDAMEGGEEEGVGH